MLILIPTYGRVNRQVTHDHLCSELRKETLLVVSQAEEPVHRRAGRGVLQCPVQGAGMASVRAWCMDWCNRAGHEKVLFLDDDLKLQKWGDDLRGSGDATPTQQREMVRWVDRALDHYAHCAFTRRNDAWSDPEETCEATRGIQAVGYNVTEVVAVGCRFDAGVPPWFFMEDYHMTLQLLEKGLPNLVHRRYRINYGDSNAPGGCSDHRTQERMREAAQLLERLHPETVRAVEKTTRGSYGGGSRWDVKVFWRKAYESGKANPRLNAGVAARTGESSNRPG